MTSNGACFEDPETSLCAEFATNGDCMACAQGSFFNASGLCEAIDPECFIFNERTLQCTDCFDGFTLVNFRCQIVTVTPDIQVPNCIAYNINNLEICVECVNRFFLSNNECLPVSDFCNTYDDRTGLCLTCFSRFRLVNGECI